MTKLQQISENFSVCSVLEKALSVKAKSPDAHFLLKLPKLPFEYAHLEPVIPRQIMSLHHSKHHQAYVTNSNTIVNKKEDLTRESLGLSNFAIVANFSKV